MTKRLRLASTIKIESSIISKPESHSRPATDHAEIFGTVASSSNYSFVKNSFSFSNPAEEAYFNLVRT
jgi:hypothetical protein